MQIFRNWGKIEEGVIRYVSQTNSILHFGLQITVQNFIKMESKLRPYECLQSDWQNNRITDVIFKRERRYCFQRVLAMAILSFRLSVCPSVTRVEQSKTMQARITNFSPSAAWKTLVSGTVKLFHKFQRVTPNESVKWKGVKKMCDF